MIIDKMELKRRYLLRLAGVRDEKVYVGPKLVSLSITDSCNLRCRYCCSIHSPGNPHHLEKSRFLSWETFVEIVRDCVDLNVDHINIAGGGEPTTHPLFRDMIRHLEQQPLKVTVFSNGTFPVDYCSDVMKTDLVRINIGAVNSQQYLDLHGKDFFDRVMANMEQLASLRDADKPGFMIDISYIVNALNVDRKKEMRDLVHRLGVHKVHFIEMSLTQYNKDIALEDEEKRTPVACLNGWFFIEARSDGDFTHCPWIYHLNRADIDQEPLKAGSLKEAWLSKRMMSRRLLGKCGYFAKKFKACQNCLFHDKNIERLKDLEGIL